MITTNQEPYQFSKTPLEIVREYFPGVPEGEAETILWEFTGWPCFWAGDPEESLRAQLAELKESGERERTTP